MTSKPPVLLLWIGFLLFFISSLISCKETSVSLTKIEGKQLQVSDSLQADSLVNSFIQPYKQAVDKEMDSVIAYAPRTLSKNDGPYNTPLGNMMADAVYEMANPIFNQRTGEHIDVVLFNHGGIRSNINEGAITTRTAYEIMPFENMIVVVLLNGNQLQEMVDYLESGRAHPFTGMNLQIDSENGTIKNALVQGQPIDTSGSYWVCTSDYLQQGGDNMTFLTRPQKIVELDYKVRNAYIDYFKKHDTIAPVRDNRFTQAQL